MDKDLSRMLLKLQELNSFDMGAVVDAQRLLQERTKLGRRKAAPHPFDDSRRVLIGEADNDDGRMVTLSR